MKATCACHHNSPIRSLPLSPNRVLIEDMLFIFSLPIRRSHTSSYSVDCYRRPQSRCWSIVWSPRRRYQPHESRFPIGPDRPSSPLIGWGYRPAKVVTRGRLESSPKPRCIMWYLSAAGGRATPRRGKVHDVAFPPYPRVLRAFRCIYRLFSRIGLKERRNGYRRIAESLPDRRY